MYCIKCGEQIADEALSCPHCGAVVPAAYLAKGSASLSDACEKYDSSNSNDGYQGSEAETIVSGSSSSQSCVDDEFVSTPTDSIRSSSNPSAVEKRQCLQCGALNDADTYYCQSCGAWFPQMKKGVSTFGDRVEQFNSSFSSGQSASSVGKAKADNSKTMWVALSVVQLVVALMGFLPVLTLNVPFVGGDYSLFDLMGVVQFLQSYSSGTASSGLGMISIGIITVIVLGIAAAVIGAVNIYRTSHADRFLMSGFALTAVVGIVCIGVSMYLSSQLTSSLGMSGGSSASVVSTSIWVWIMFLASIGGAIAGGYFREMDRKA